MTRDQSRYLFVQPYLNFITEGKIKPVLPNPKDYQFYNLLSLVDAQKELLGKNLSGVIDTIAERFREHGGHLLAGDRANARAC